jgi:hypothetical protein
MTEEIKVDPEILREIDRLLKHSEDNGWNAAINAARFLLPVEYSRVIRTLYRTTALKDAE